MNPHLAGLLAAALLLTGRAGAADLPIDGIVVGAAVSAVARDIGRPAAVASVDAGQRFEFADGAVAWADDDGIVLAVEARAGVPRVAIDGVVRSFPIGAYTTARADTELSAVAEFAGASVRSFRLAPRRDLVLAFGDPAGRLRRVVFGEPGQLARLGFLPGDPAAKAVVYRAPQPLHAADPPSGAGRPAAVYRLGVNRFGEVLSADVIIPSQAPAGDAGPIPALLSERYRPATLDGRPIAATVFVERGR